MKYFSKSTIGFYDDSIHQNMPEDAVEISEILYLSLLNDQSSGKLIEGNDSGYPVAVERAPLSGNGLIRQQIFHLEESQTLRRMREALEGADNGWLQNLNSQISFLRSQLT